MLPQYPGVVLSRAGHWRRPERARGGVWALRPAYIF